MQLIFIYLVVFFLVFTKEIKAQLKNNIPVYLNPTSDRDTVLIDTARYQEPDWQTIDIDFLNSYYAQDGNNAAVTGGIGTEELTDFTQKIILSVPVSPKLTLNLDGGYDYYSSASTDNIDNIQSSGSSSDTRKAGNIGFDYAASETQSWGLNVGCSNEYDYKSLITGAHASIKSKDKNTILNLNAQAFIDVWRPVYPVELRATTKVTTDRRNSFNASVGLARVLTQKMQIYLQAEATYMNGLLSTPFHRVYFQEQDIARIENLPNQRLKIPIGLRFNTYLTEWMIARTYYRYYWDDWGIQGHTAGIELPIKLNRFLSVYPFYRYHTQTAAQYFKPYKEHSIQDIYYTSDYDLSALDSHAYGIGASFSPANGIVRANLPFKTHPLFMVKGIDLKYSHYDRSTGLKANIGSIGVSLSF